jgi:proline iminopeptidase
MPLPALARTWTVLGVLLVSACAHIPERQQDFSGIHIPVRQGYATTDDSVRLFWRTVGEGGDTLVVLHGGPAQGHINTVAPDLMPLAVGRTLLFYDQRGAGRSSAVRDTASLNVRHSVRDLEALRRHFGLERITLLGYSFGGLLAGLYAIEHPERVERMVLVAALGPTIATSRVFNPAARIDSTLNAVRLAHNQAWRSTRTDSTKACWDYWMIWIRGFYARTPDHRRMWGDVCNVPQSNLVLPVRTYPQRSLDAWDLTAGLRRVSAPVLVIHGDEDSNPVQAAKNWVAALPNARLFLIEKTGHFPQVDRPSVFFPAVEAFLRGEWPEPARLPGRAGAMGSVPQGSSLYERTFREIWAVDEKLIDGIARADWKQVASLYADDATIFAPGSPPVHTPQAIAAFWQAARKKGLRSLELQIMELEGHGDIVHSIGKYTMRGENAEELDIGKFLAVWKKVDGEWRFHRDIFNSSLETRSPLEVPDYLTIPDSGPRK